MIYRGLRVIALIGVAAAAIAATDFPAISARRSI
jgi:hypothetical protein